MNLFDMMPCQQLPSFQFIRLGNAGVVVSSPLPTLGKSFPPKLRRILSLDLGGHLILRPLLRFLNGIVCFSVPSIQIIFFLG